MLLEKIDDGMKHFIDFGALSVWATMGVKRFLFDFTATHNFAMDVMIFVSTFASMVWLVIRAVNAVIEFYKTKIKKDEK
jgi:hypothetical protein